jgi:cyclic pyranopterin phosphate synthase
MTTNGLLLAPQAAALRKAGLTKLNVSLDTFRAERFGQITLRPGLAQVLEGIEAALAAGFTPLKLNVVVMRGVNDDEVPDFVEFARERPVQVRFIEFMPFAGNAWSQDKLVTYAEIRASIAKHYELRRNPLDHDPHNTAREYVIEGFRGGVAFITSMTNDFCATCNRVRLTADGNLKACLFDNGELDVRSALRAGADDTALEALLRRAVQAKPAGHVPMEELSKQKNRSMITIGG